MSNKIMTDLEISRSANKINIKEVATNAGFNNENVYVYGNFKAKVKQSNKPRKGKLVLVTAISPTPAGEGKTTTTIGLHDGFAKKGFKSIAALREPSLGPVFGVKGGAAGGGQSQVVPIEDINLHFNGDMHAITSANNLISAMVDNHIYWGNELNIEKVTWKRCLDVNDRSLRKMNLVTNKGVDIREESFNITAASEVMAIMSLSKDLDDLRKRIDKAIVGYDKNDNPIFVKDVKATGSVIALLKEAFMPNLVQTIENNPVLVHCGPFANIAHGCNSIVATEMALQEADYVVTEAGFGSDLGAEKFLNIKSRTADLKPGAIVLVATIRALKMHGGVAKDSLDIENLEALKEGISNIEQHLKSLQTFGVPIVISINKFVTDTDQELELIKSWATDQGVESTISEGWEFGGNGTLELVEKIDKIFDATTPNFTYDINDEIEVKIEKVAKTIYGAAAISISDEAKDKIAKFKKWGLDKQLICIAKTQTSFSDDPKLLGAPKGWTLNVKDLDISNGAGFIVVKCGTIMTMPGLSRDPQAHRIDVKDGEITGLS